MGRVNDFVDGDKVDKLADCEMDDAELLGVVRRL